MSFLAIAFGLALLVSVGPEVFSRHILIMAALTLSLFVVGYGLHGPGRVNPFEGVVLLTCFVGYTLAANPNSPI